MHNISVSSSSSSTSQGGCFSNLQTSLMSCCQKVWSVFTGCVSQGLSDDEIPLLNQISSMKYSQKGLTASEKLKKQLVYAIKDRSHAKKWFLTPFTFSNLEPKLEPANFTTLDSAAAQAIGKCQTQEDGFLKPAKVRFNWKGEEIESLVFGVIDGHGDRGTVSLHCNEHLAPSLETLLTKAADENEE